MAIIKNNHPILHEMYSKYALQPTKSSENHEQTRQRFVKHVKESLERRCRLILEWMTGDEFWAQDTKWKEIKDRFMAETAQLESTSARMKQLNQRIESNHLKLLDGLNEYNDIRSKYLKEFKIDFKLKYDEVQVNLLCSQIQALRFTSRRDETKKLVESFGSESKVREETEKRKQLKLRMAELDEKIAAANRKLTAFNDSISADLLAEFKATKQKLEDRREAKALLANDDSATDNDTTNASVSGYNFSFN